jgi:hypothetical protein
MRLLASAHPISASYRNIKRNNKEQLSYGAEGWLLEYQE